MSLEEFHQAPEKVEPMVHNDGRVIVTRNGEAVFEVIPPRKPGVREFARKIDKIWEGCDIRRSTEEMIKGLRESRE